jgi:hypothetical protein
MKKIINFFTLILMATFLFVYNKVFAQDGQQEFWYGSPGVNIVVPTVINPPTFQEQFLNFLDKYFSLCIVGVLVIVGIVVGIIYLVNEHKRNKIGIKEKPIKK